MPEHKKAAMAALKARGKALIQEIYSSQEKAVVFGEGSLSARLMLVGEAPGEQEALQGRPFVGKAGKNLDGFLGTLGIRREDIWITNVVKFRPVKAHPRTGSLSNRPPSREEIELCFHILLGELEIIRPAVVVTLGNVALKAASGDRRAVIGACHGMPAVSALNGIRFTLFPLYHPASIIYNRELAGTYEEDLKALRNHLAEAGLTGRRDTTGRTLKITELAGREKTVALATPSNLRLGMDILLAGGVEIIKNTPFHVTATVAGGQRRQVELAASEQGLVWKCSCLGKRREFFCKHCVALALALQQASVTDSID